MLSSRSRALVTAAIVAGVLARGAFALGYWVDEPLTHDEQEYLQLGRNLAAGHGFRYDDPPAGDRPAVQYGRAPLYPAFLAAIALAGGPDRLPRNARIAQALVGGVVILFIALLAHRAAGEGAAVVAACVAAVHPPLSWIPAFLLSETLYAAVALCGAWLLGRAIDGEGGIRHDDRRIGWLAGFLSGTAVLVRPAHLFFLFVVGLWLLWRRRAKLLVPLTLASLLVVLPWTVRNYAAYGRFVLVASEGGITFWAGNHPYSAGEGDMAANPAIKIDSWRFRSEHAGLSEEALEPLFYREAFERIAESPGWWLGLLARKAFYTVVPAGPSYTLHSPRHRAATLVSWGVLLPLGVLGYLRLRRQGTWPRALLLLAAAAVLASLVFLPQERFRIPVLDPTVIVGAAAWWTLRRSPLPRAEA